MTAMKADMYPVSHLRSACALVALLGLHAASLGGPNRVESFSPQGTARAVTQVSLRFNEDMVPMGQVNAPPPLILRCDGAPAFAGRWLDSRRWVAEFDRPLAAGIRCEATLRPDLRSLLGDAISGPANWAFDSGGPQLETSWPGNWPREISETQEFLMLANAPLDRSSLVKGLRCQARGDDAAEHAVTLLDQSRTADLWAAQHKEAPQDPPLERLVAFRCAQPLPAGARVNVIWGRAIATPHGLRNETDEEVGHWEVRPAFAGALDCGKVLGSAGCDPRQDLRLYFGVDALRRDLEAVRLENSKGEVLPLFAVTPQPWASEHDGDQPGPDGEKDEGPTANTLTTRLGPDQIWTEGESLRLHIPPGLQDKHGRPLSNTADFPMAISIAHLPPYLGFTATAGRLPWQPGQTSAWPLAARKLEPSVEVRWMRLGAQSRPPMASGHTTQQQDAASVAAMSLWKQHWNLGCEHTFFARTNTILGAARGFRPNPVQAWRDSIHAARSAAPGGRWL
jgi:hypothetical protein